MDDDDVFFGTGTAAIAVVAVFLAVLIGAAMAAVW